MGQPLSVVLALLVAAAFVFARARARSPLRLAWARIREGRPRAGRAVARLFARRASEARRPGLALLEAHALFWEGSFARAESLLAKIGANDEASIALSIACLLFDERRDEARRLFLEHERALRANRALRADVAVIGAFLWLFEGDLEAARLELERVFEDARTPIGRAAHLCAAAIMERSGRPADARPHLAAAIAGGGELFPARWAEARWVEAFPGEAPPPRGSAKRRRRARWLKAAAFALVLRPSAMNEARFTPGAVVALALFDAAAAIGLRFLDYRPDAFFFAASAVQLALPILAFPLTALAAAGGARPALLRVAGTFYAALPVILSAAFAASRAPEAMLYELAVGVWALAIVIGLARGVRASVVRTLASAVLFALTCVAPWSIAIDTPVFFAPPRPRADEGFRYDPSARSVALFAELERVQTAEAALSPQRPGVRDLYFIGVAGYAAQDVFAREARAARAVMDERFDTRGRSIVLLNDPTTRDVEPLASVAGLRHAIRTVGRKMDPDEDMLFFFATSHGSSAGLSLKFPERTPFDDEVLRPLALRGMLDEAGIKWRILVLAGCESGVFVDALRTEESVVFTAAADDRFSYGCANGRAFTDFGRTVFDDQLPKTPSILDAFRNALAQTERREAEQKLTPSNPRLFVGSAIARRLAR